MHYIIDGYNMMFRVLNADDDLQVKREQILKDLSIKIHYLGIKVSFVFDGQEAQKIFFHDLPVYFSSIRQTADEYILEMLKMEQEPSQTTVVTSDKKLAWLTRRAKAKTESVEDFLTWLNKRFRNKIRRKKLPQKEFKPLKKKKPELTSMPEECFDYYLEIFESRSGEIPVPPETKKKEKKLKTKEKPLSDMERWQKAFEKKITEESEDD